MNEPRLFKLLLVKGQLHSEHQVVVEKESVHTMYPNWLVGPWKDLSKHLGTQSRWHTVPGRCVFCLLRSFLPPQLFDSQRDSDNRGNMRARRAALPEVWRNEVGVGEIQAAQCMANSKGTRNQDYSNKQVIKT